MSFFIIGSIAAACTTFSFLPQAIQVIKTKQTQHLNLWMYLIFTSGVLMWLLYGCLTKDLPVIIANAITFVFAASILTMKLIYK